MARWQSRLVPVLALVVGPDVDVAFQTQKYIVYLAMIAHTDWRSLGAPRADDGEGVVGLFAPDQQTGGRLGARNTNNLAT